MAGELRVELTKSTPLSVSLDKETPLSVTLAKETPLSVSLALDTEPDLQTIYIAEVGDRYFYSEDSTQEDATLVVYQSRWAVDRDKPGPAELEVTSGERVSIVSAPEVSEVPS